MGAGLEPPTPHAHRLFFPLTLFRWFGLHHFCGAEKKGNGCVSSDDDEVWCVKELQEWAFFDAGPFDSFLDEMDLSTRCEDRSHVSWSSYHCGCGCRWPFFTYSTHSLLRKQISHWIPAKC